MNDRSGRNRWWARQTSRDGRAGASGSAFRRRPSLDALEERTLLSAAPTGVNLGDFYYYDNQPFPLDRALDQFLVGTKETGPTQKPLLDDLTRPGELLAGGDVSRTADGKYWIVSLAAPASNLDALKALGDQLAAVPGVTSVAESFFDPISGGRAWASNEIVVDLASGVDPAAFFAAPDFASYRHLRGTTDQYLAVTNAAPGPETLGLANRLQVDPRVDFSAPGPLHRRPL